MEYDGEWLLISVHPIWASKLLDGTKRIELRKVRPRVRRGSRVLIYSTSPECALVGWFVVEDVVSDDPQDIWNNYSEVAGVSKDQFDIYYQGAEVAIGLVVNQPSRLETPVSLEQLRAQIARFHPPQCYRYLSPNDCALLGIPKH